MIDNYKPSYLLLLEKQNIDKNKAEIDVKIILTSIKKNIKTNCDIKLYYQNLENKIRNIKIRKKSIKYLEIKIHFSKKPFNNYIEVTWTQEIKIAKRILPNNTLRDQSIKHRYKISEAVQK